MSSQSWPLRRSSADVRQTKIIATIGPVSASDTVIGQLVAAGVDLFRLNFSHGTHDSHAAVIDRVRRAAAASGRIVSILQDLSGPKMRTGSLAGDNAIQLRAGDALTIEVGDFPGESGRISTTFAALPGAVRAGDVLLLDDGRIQLKVDATSVRAIQTTVVDGGELGERKGINAPGVELPIDGLTDKDLDDLKFGVAVGVDFMALSFVQKAADLEQARAALRDAGGAHVPLVAKLERPHAIERLDDVLRASDAVMVARGDLGLELPLERVPTVQKQVTSAARALGVPVIVATQVLESMRSEPRPTRAEVSDAANAVCDRVDAIMLAGETAIGEHPVEAVAVLDRSIREAETLPAERFGDVQDTHTLPVHGRAICDAALTLAEHADAAAIVAVTRGGKTVRVLSALRPRVPIVAVTDQEQIARRLTLSWGVRPMVADLSGDLVGLADRLRHELVQRGAVPASSVIVIVSVTPDLAPGPSNFLKLQRV
jgi:pyruvate kinase